MEGCFVAKIDFKKVEENLLKALQSRFIKKLIEGEATVSEQAVTYYGMDSGPRPKPQDAVIQELEQIEQEEKEFTAQEKRRLEVELAQKEGRPIPPEQKPELPIAKEEPKLATPQPPQVEKREHIETTHDVSFTPLFLLRKHILWFKQRKVKDMYKLLGITPEEIRELRKKKSLSDVENKKIQALLLKAKEMKVRVMKKLGIAKDSSLVEKERKKHINKRFNIKDTWLPL